jgi:hypothetical protein
MHLGATMNYTGNPQWPYDLFFSYARLDNRKGFGGTRWVSTFRDMLRDAIQAKTGCRVSHFFDETTDENPDAESFAAWASQTAVLIPVITPTYLTRPWCEIEFKAFCDARGGHKNIVAVQPFPLPEGTQLFPKMEKLFPTQLFDNLDDRPKRFRFGTTLFEDKFEVFTARVIRKLDELKAEYAATLVSQP